MRQIPILVLIFLASATRPVSAQTGSLKLAWDPSSDVVSGYVVGVGTSPGVYGTTIDVGNVTQYSVTGLVPGVTYYFSVAAYDSTGAQSGYATEVPGMVMGASSTTPSPTIAGTLPMPMDVAWEHSTGGDLVAWHLNGTAVVGMEGIGPGRINPAWTIRGMGDLNRDGKPDLIWQHGDGSLAVWFMDGPTILDTRYLTVRSVGDPQWKIVGVADLNNDGRDDIIWQHQTGGWLAAWLMWDNMVLDTRWLSPQRVTDVNWHIMAVGDIDGHGHNSLIWQHALTGAIRASSIEDFVIGPLVALSIDHVSDLNWQVRGLKDLNDDGRADLIFQHMTGGWVAAWFLNGTSVVDTEWLSFNQVIDPSFHIVAVSR